MLDLEDIYESINPFGLVQVLLTVTLACTRLSYSFFPLLLNLLSTYNTWDCVTDRCDPSLPLCQQKLGPGDWVYPLSNASNSFIKDLDLACGMDSSLSLVNGLFFAGHAIGNLNFFTDRIGRKYSLVMMLFALGISAISRIIKDDFVMFSFLHILCGVFVGATGNISMMYQCELIHARFRNLAIQIHSVAYDLGMIYGTLLVMYLDSWQGVCVMMAMPAFLLGFFVLFFKESPYWLLSVGRMEELHEVLHWMATINKRSYDWDMPLKKSDDNEEEANDSIHSQSHDVQKPTISLLHVFTKSSINRRTALGLIFCSIAVSFLYWSLWFTVGSLAGNIFQNQLIICSLNLINRPINWLGMKYLKRARFFLICNGVMCVLAVVCMIPTDIIISTSFTSFTLQKICAILFRAVIDMVYWSLALYITEIFPTRIRASGSGMCSGIARIGTFVAVYAVFLSNQILFAVILSLCTVMFILFFWIPETADKALPETLQDMEDLWLKRKQGKNDSGMVLENCQSVNSAAATEC